MGKVNKHPLVKLIVGFIAADEELFSLAERSLCLRFGVIDFQSEILPFDFTDYYEEEIGKNLKRKFISFKKLISAELLAEIKIFTNRLEQRFEKENEAPRAKARGFLERNTERPLFIRTLKGAVFWPRMYKRRLNIDPGYLTSAKLVLASTKDFYHRIFLKKGVFAEVTIFYAKNSFRPFKWTYPDYRTQDYLTIFNHLRENYLRQIKEK